MMATSLLRARSAPAEDIERQAGYTLLELLVVMGILAVLTATATPRVMGRCDKAKVQSAQSQIQDINPALALYSMDTGGYPSSEEGLKALAEAPADARRAGGPDLKQQGSLTDPWGHAYRYAVPHDAGGCSVYPLGPTGTASEQNRRAPPA